ncbi:hypothetical protein P296_21130 [Salmonella enterica subsp. arizonae serovar 18:z4,z23:- str. CVM N26624]|uniref:Uncharacterized protein n=1 Tax=Salmonella enterica subsp. arizonae serovar 18:z4,z23:- str. CVM N26626 TaxID=1395119 RepID=A0A3S5YK05_SALER|nr:hypothetical protein P296_21130 [Salmonella enterica subsp. arizonae serovar 18:z4,z23:- str. CVM N26624]OLV99709.1 hypothetical protein P298_15500 [Salmonella enterica subsp. arizonae serovar 18:z4,z23:- str. CVM N26626]OLW00371.1 hypothetical protein P297_12750 [Salmonella enterica subsp. arizonae serovar 18:z4,z23:- str. CVM N26625]OLW06195.1 hypothetical protein P295_03735 [Salmonella enterica subsp. arizonae serovar 18:z4,z23:- str. CVM N25373]OLW07113.1 hypothetical protein P292_07780 
MGVSSEQAINLLGMCGWLNRLKIALDETD